LRRNGRAPFAPCVPFVIPVCPISAPAWLAAGCARGWRCRCTRARPCQHGPWPDAPPWRRPKPLARLHGYAGRFLPKNAAAFQLYTIVGRHWRANL